MKNFKFSRLFAAAFVVACLALTGCKPAPDAAGASIYGTWASDAGEKYEISSTKAAETGWDMWAFDIQEYKAEGTTAGVFYGLLTKGSQWTPAGTYYAVAYKNLTNETVTIASASTSYATLEEVKANCTIENMFAYSSECRKQ